MERVRPKKRRPDFWTYAELEEHFGCSRWTIQRRIAEGRLDPPVRLGPNSPRFPDASIQRYEDALRAEALANT
jgi:predicted DNA-binding transcriptional regulator AlpA